jgi:hypothetical protein
MSWVGVDLDGTLAVWRQSGPPGEPVEEMVAMVKGLLFRGVEVRIFTARASNPALVPEVEEWCMKHIGWKLPVTCSKDFECIAIYDDIAHHIGFNTGKLCPES